MRPEDTVLRVTPRGLGDAATAWCGVAVATRAELFAAGWTGGEATDADEAWNVVSALMADESPAAIEREVRARGVLAGLCSRLLRDYPSFAKYPSLAGGWGGVRGARRTRWRRAGREKMEAVGVPPRETRRRRWCWRRRRGRSAEPSRLRRIVTRPRVGEEAPRSRGGSCGARSFIRVCNRSLQKVRVGIGSSQSPFGIALRDPPQQKRHPARPQRHTPSDASSAPSAMSTFVSAAPTLAKLPGARARAPPRRVGARFARRSRLRHAPKTPSSDSRVARPASPSARRRSPSLPPLPRTPWRVSSPTPPYSAPPA